MLIEGQTAQYLHCILFKEGIRLVWQKERDESFHVTPTLWGLFHDRQIALKLCLYSCSRAGELK
jgi:hypothetical protein